MTTNGAESTVQQPSPGFPTRLWRDLKRSWREVRPTGSELRDSSVTALPLAAAAVPDGMASATLAGVNPIHGLYGGFAGPLIGGLFASTRLMVVGTTSAASLAVYSVLSNVDADRRVPTMVVVGITSGLLMLAAGWAGWGRFASFVSHAVMTGFLTGVSVSIFLSQIPDLAGAPSEGSTTVERAINVVLNPDLIDGPTLTIGLVALVLLVIGDKSRFADWAPLAVLIGLSAVAVSVDWFDSVALVGDISEIDPGLPPFALPDFSLFNVDILASAASLAVIVLVQGAGVAQAFPNTDGRRANPNGDFAAQGWANIASGLIRGIPVGATIGSTAMSVSMGARSRWVSILSGVWMLAVLVALSGLAEQVAMPTLAAILIGAAIASVNPRNVSLVWRSGSNSRIIMLVTFVATLVLPIGAAVASGIALSAVLYIGGQAADVRLVRLIEEDDGSVSIVDPPDDLESDVVTVLAVSGSMFFAAARRIEDLLPRVGSSHNAVVVLRLEGQRHLDATATLVLSKYAAELDAAGGALVLSEVPGELAAQLSPELFGEDGPIQVVEATRRLDESTRETAYRIAAEDRQSEAATDANVDRDPFVRRVARMVVEGDQAED